VNWVHGNLYWLTEYPGTMTNGGETPRCGYRYYRVSPNYRVLEFAVGPNSDAKHQVKPQFPERVDYRRVVRIDLATGEFLDPRQESADSSSVPVAPFQGKLLKRGDEMKNYVPSLDPVRVPGTMKSP
jgi:hypothetical protein